MNDESISMNDESMRQHDLERAIFDLEDQVFECKVIAKKVQLMFDNMTIKESQNFIQTKMNELIKRMEAIKVDIKIIKDNARWK